MTLRHFQIFKAVCDHNGATAASEQLNITQPSVSIAIRELENYYETKLFDRINRKMYLTEEGMLLRRYVDTVLEQCEEATEVLRNGRTFVRCRLGVNVTFAESHLAGLLTEIRTRLPECDLQIAAQNNEQLEAMIMDNKIDFAIFDEMSEQSVLCQDRLFQEKEVLLISRKCREQKSVSVEELAELPLLLREEGSGIRNGVDKLFRMHGALKKVFMESTSTMSLLEAARDGLGVVFLPESLAQKYSEGMHVVEIREESLYRKYYLAYNQRKHMTKMLNDVRETVLSFCTETEKHENSGWDR